MPWNEPGSGDKDPWNRKDQKQGPPDLDELVKNISDRVNTMLGSKKKSSGGGGGGGSSTPTLPGKFSILLIALIAFAVWVGSGFYTIQQGEQGVVLRLGKYTDSKDAGLHWRPRFIDEVEKVNVQNINTVEVGYRANGRGSGKVKQEREALMLTEDENIIDIEFAVQYDIKDPRQLLFNVSEPASIVVRSATESAVREIVGRNSMDFAITEGRAAIASETKALVQEILDRFETGINIKAVEAQNAQPPSQVKAAFDDAVKAREDQVRAKNRAEAYSNDILPRARGGAARVVQEAEGYKASVVSRAEGDAQRFASILEEYSKAPAITRDRLYIETMEEVLSNASKLMIDKDASSGSVMYLPLDQLLKNSSSSGRIMPSSGSPLNALPTSSDRSSRSSTSQTTGTPLRQGRNLSQ